MNQLSGEEAAALLGVSLHTLHRLIFTRGLPATDAGWGRYTIDESALRQWMDAHAAALQSLPNDEERDKLTGREAMDLLRFRHTGEFNHARAQGLPSYGTSGGERFSREVVLRWFRRRVKGCIFNDKGILRMLSLRSPDSTISFTPTRFHRVLSYGEHSAMLMLRSYMDESGKYDDPNIQTVSVCGAVSSLSKWTIFEEEWKQILEDYQVTWFHMKDFAHFRGEFNGWEEARRREFIARLIDVMDKNIIGYLAATMSKYDFERLTEPQRLAIGNDPYYPCFAACVINSAQTVFNLAPEEKIQLFFADNPDFKGNAHAFWQRCKSQDAPEDISRRLGTVTLNAEPRDVLPLQAADLVAYEVNHHLTEMYKHGKWPEERWPFNKVKEKMLYIDVFDRPTLATRFGFR